MRFDNIIGNEKIKRYLSKEIENNTIVHSYIFSGIESVGKLMFAKEFANKILCAQKFNAKSELFERFFPDIFYISIKL